jgi:hypothetical protein
MPPKITMSAIRELQKRMQEAPEYEATEVSMVKAIQLLAPDIRAMKAKGYTMDQIAQTLRDAAIPIAATTLKSYLSRFTFDPDLTPLPHRKRRGTNSRVAAENSPEKRPEASTNEAQDATGTTSHQRGLSPSSEARISTERARRNGGAPAVSTTEPTQGPTSSSAERYRPHYTSFTPREDTKDL